MADLKSKYLYEFVDEAWKSQPQKQHKLTLATVKLMKRLRSAGSFEMYENVKHILEDNCKSTFQKTTENTNYPYCQDGILRLAIVCQCENCDEENKRLAKINAEQKKQEVKQEQINWKWSDNGDKKKITDYRLEKKI